MPPADVVDGVVERAVAVLRGGGLVGLPTETVYGLGADASNRAAVLRIFAAKGRPADHPLIVHVSDANALDHWGRALPPAATLLAASFWPGPMTLIVPKAEHVLAEVTGGQDTVGVRVPAHPLAYAILAAFGGGVAAPSANKFGRVSPTRAEHVAADLGSAVDFIADGGECTVGIESTIVDLSSGEPRILRPGAVTQEAIEQVLGHVVLVGGGEVRAPGVLASHYAPKAKVVLATPEEIPARLSEYGSSSVVLSRRAPMTPARWIELPADDAGYARKLYAVLRQADDQGAPVIIIEPPPPAGLGRAILDRLQKAAAHRILG